MASRGGSTACSGGHGLDIACSSCLHSHEARGEPSALACDGDVFQCSTCLLGFHAKCDAQMGEVIKVSLGSWHLSRAASVCKSSRFSSADDRTVRAKCIHGRYRMFGQKTQNQHKQPRTPTHLTHIHRHAQQHARSYAHCTHRQTHRQSKQTREHTHAQT